MCWEVVAADSQNLLSVISKNACEWSAGAALWK